MGSGQKAQRRTWNIIDGVSGVLKPGRLTLLLGTPGSGRSVLMKALAGRLGHEKTLKVRVCRTFLSCPPWHQPFWWQHWAAFMLGETCKSHIAAAATTGQTCKAESDLVPPAGPRLAPAGHCRRADLQRAGPGRDCAAAHRRVHFPGARCVGVCVLAVPLRRGTARLDSLIGRRTVQPPAPSLVPTRRTLRSHRPLQLDAHYGELTVRQTLDFAARVQGGRRGERAAAARPYYGS